MPLYRRIARVYKSHVLLVEDVILPSTTIFCPVYTRLHQMPKAKLHSLHPMRLPSAPLEPGYCAFACTPLRLLLERTVWREYRVYGEYINPETTVLSGILLSA